MAQELKPGSRWASAVDDTEVIVVKAGGDGLSLECGGHPMVAGGTDKPADLTIDDGFAGGTQVGKRFEHSSGLELLCTKAGAGTLAVDGEAVPLKESKPLPSSD
ncbi:MAG TPA: hypothetical protein VG435_07250 [Acidimicrobiales bacterium]|jgi:hypothetical protein|nr:hypothetical protein [Acidimicrobiales bacterium]